MILGLGNDIIEVARIKANILRYSHRFLNRIFTPLEQKYCLQRKESSLHFAGRFAVKEAVAKALGTGFSGGFSWTDIEIINDVHGKPTVKINDKFAHLLKGAQLHISISHCRDYATAVAVLA